MSDFQIQPMQVGTLRVEWPVFLAPMAGYTDGAFRSLCLEQGCGAVVTEMVSAHGMSIGHERTGHYLDLWGAEHPIGAQLYGSDPGRMAVAAGAVLAACAAPASDAQPLPALGQFENIVERVRILCTVYDEETGEYRYDYKLILVVLSGVLFFLSTLIYLGLEWRNQRRQRRQLRAPCPSTPQPASGHGV